MFATRKRVKLLQHPFSMFAKASTTTTPLPSTFICIRKLGNRAILRLQKFSCWEDLWLHLTKSIAEASNYKILGPTFLLTPAHNKESDIYRENVYGTRFFN